jgi:hypothetical protein
VATQATLAPDDAWKLYIAHLAHIFAVEIASAVPWSFADYGTEEDNPKIKSLLNYSYICGDLYGEAGQPWTGYRIYFGVLPAPPNVAYRFLKTNHLISYDRLDTIRKVLEWCWDNLTHFGNLEGMTPKEIREAHWQYSIPTVSRIINGTYCANSPRLGVRHYTAGCSGTADFLEALLRVINIPVERSSSGPHMGVHFLSENLYLSHGDDVLGSKAIPPIPVEEFLVDEATYNACFTDEADSFIRNRNVDRRLYELYIKYLPDTLLHAEYLDDREGQGISTDSHVYNYFQWYYDDERHYRYDLETLQNGAITMADGEQVQCDLWNRIETKMQQYPRSGKLEPYSFEPLYSLPSTFYDFLKRVFESVHSAIKSLINLLSWRRT